jgi:hypothetical protein
MDISLSFRKYIENHRIGFITSILFIFTLFLINPLFSLFGGSLNISYNLFSGLLDDIISSLLAILIMIFIYSILQSTIIFRIRNTYEISEKVKYKDIKKSLYKVYLFNILYFLIFYFISLVLYKLNLLNNIITQIILFIIAILLWFVPQVIVIEERNLKTSIYTSIIYWKNNWFHLITLLFTSFILVLLAIFIDGVFLGITGTIISSIFMVLFVIPYIEILKTEIYLNKYRLLKPRQQL